MRQAANQLKISKLTLRNDSAKTRKLSVTHYVEWTLGEQREDTQQHIVTQWDPELGVILARNGYHPEYGDRVAFARSVPHLILLHATGLFFGRNQPAQTPLPWSGTHWPGGSARNMIPVVPCRQNLN